MEVSLEQTIQMMKVGLGILTLGVGYLSYKLAKLNSRIGTYNIKQSSLKELRSIPIIDPIDVVDTQSGPRVKLLVHNLRSDPFYIYSLTVYKPGKRSLTIRNIFKYGRDSFKWNHVVVDHVFWNPKGDLDDEEHYFREAAQFLRVKDSEYLLVSIPEFKEHLEYHFEIKTNIGNRRSSGSISAKSNTLFSTNYSEYNY